jgi:hypothetical protein
VRTLISDFDDLRQGATGTPFDLTLDFSGYLMVVVASVFQPVPAYQLLRVDPVSGARAVVSDDLRDTCGGGAVREVAVAETGDILVVGGNDEAGFLYRLSPVTGACTELSGPFGQTRDVAVVPTPLVNEMVTLSVASTTLEPTSVPFAPSGVFRITATFTNLTSDSIRQPFFRVAAFGRQHAGQR